MGSAPPRPFFDGVVSQPDCTFLTEEDVMKFAQLHLNLIRNMAINKRKQDKRKGEKPPPLVRAQKKAKGNE